MFKSSVAWSGETTLNAVKDSRPSRCRSVRRFDRQLVRAVIETLEIRRLLSGVMVTNTSDTGAGSLAAAITLANADTTTDDTYTITYASNLAGKTIDSASALTLSNGPGGLTIVIDATAARGLTVAGGGSNSNYSVFTVLTSTTASLTGLTITDGNNTGGGGGGGVNDQGTLTLTNDTLSDNSAGVGGGAYSSGTLTLNGCTVSGNSLAGSENFAGGIVNGGGSLMITNSTITNNTGQVGGIANVAGGGGTTTTVIDSTITGNTGTIASGGIFNVGGDPRALKGGQPPASRLRRL